VEVNVHNPNLIKKGSVNIKNTNNIAVSLAFIL